jgi:prepilin-type processing-associated H-X9-DG protein
LGNQPANNRRSFSNVATNVSYSVAIPYANSTAVGYGYKWNNTLSPEFAVAGDKNPFVAASNTLRTNSQASLIKAANSKNHSQDGQNVLFGDGHVEFTNTPLCGVNKDNIYTVNGVTAANSANGPDNTVDSATPTASSNPAAADDSVLMLGTNATNAIVN